MKKQTLSDKSWYSMAINTEMDGIWYPAEDVKTSFEKIFKKINKEIKKINKNLENKEIPEINQAKISGMYLGFISSLKIIKKEIGEIE